MSQAGIKKKGYLLKLPVTGIVKKWAKRWCVLFSTTHEGVVRIEYYADEISEKSQIGKRTIPLRDCSKTQQTVGDKVHPYLFEFTTQLGQHVFAAESQPELDDWLDGIRDAVHEDRMKRKMNKTQRKRTATASSGDPSQTKAQSSNKGRAGVDYTQVQASGFSKGSTHTASNITSGMYRVTLEENDTTDELNLHGTFNLVLGPTTLTIADVDTRKAIYKWHYKSLKSFGKQSGRFNFEVGKTPQGGTGSYRCITTCSKEIFGVVNRNIKIIRERMESAKREQQPQRPQGQAHRPSRRSGVVDDTVPGKYHSSENTEGAAGATTGESTDQQPLCAQDEANNYSLAGQEDNTTALFPKVQTPLKGGAPPTTPFEPQQQQQQQTGPELTQQPAAPPSSNRFSYDESLDARDSALIQLDGPLLDLEALVPPNPTLDFSNIMDLELNNDLFSQTASTAATGIDPWGGGGGGGYSASGGNIGMQSENPWGMRQGGGVPQLYGGGGQQYGGGHQYNTYGGGYGQSAGGYGQSAGGYGQTAGFGQPLQGQWSIGAGQQQQSGGGFGASPQVPTAQAQPKVPQKALSQEEFDRLWDELCATTTNF